MYVILFAHIIIIEDSYVTLITHTIIVEDPVPDCMVSPAVAGSKVGRRRAVSRRAKTSILSYDADFAQTHGTFQNKFTCWTPPLSSRSNRCL
jgi:hypothetical protein